MSNPVAGIIRVLSGGLLGSVGQVIDNLTTTDAEKQEARISLLRLQSEFHARLAEIESENAKTAADVVKAEAQSEGWMARSWRPITMLTFTFIVAWNYVVAPLFSLHHLEMPPNLWELLQIGMGGYVFGRTAEKLVPAVTEAIVRAKQ